MNKLYLQEVKNGWDYTLYSRDGKKLISGHVDSVEFESAIDEIDTILFGIYEIGQVIFLQEVKQNG
jgi:hypothetical protein